MNVYLVYGSYVSQRIECCIMERWYGGMPLYVSLIEEDVIYIKVFFSCLLKHRVWWMPSLSFIFFSVVVASGLSPHHPTTHTTKLFHILLWINYWRYRISISFRGVLCDPCFYYPSGIQSIFERGLDIFGPLFWICFPWEEFWDFFFFNHWLVFLYSKAPYLKCRDLNPLRSGGWESL